MHVSPLSLYSFATQRLPPSGPSSATCASSAAGAPADEPTAAEAPPPPPPPPPALDSAQLMEAVASVLARANVPLDADQKQLMQKNLQLRDELRAAQAELATAQREVTQFRDTYECQICFANKVDALIDGCGHLICRACVQPMVDSTGNRCPFCRSEFTSVSHFYT